MKHKITDSSGNIFKDLGLKDPDKLMARAETMYRVSQIIKEKNLTQKEVGKLLKLPQSKISNLLNGKLSAFSMDTLLNILNMLGKDVEIIIKPMLPEESTASTHVLLAI